MVFKMARFLIFLKTRHLGTRLFWYPFGCLLGNTYRGIKTDGYQNGQFFLSFEKLTFWFPFVLAPVWVPPFSPTTMIELSEDMLCWHLLGPKLGVPKTLLRFLHFFCKTRSKPCDFQ